MVNQNIIRVEPLDPPLDPSKFATAKYTWQDLKEIITNKRFPIYRSVDQETFYRLYSRQLKQEWKSVCDFVLHCKFGFERRLISVPEPRPVSANENRANSRVNNDQSDKGGNQNNDGEMDKNDDSSSSCGVTISIQTKSDLNEGNCGRLNLPTLPLIPRPPNGYVWSITSPSTPEEIAEPQRIIAMNDFPYYMEENIEHWCLWKLGGGDVDENDIKWAKEELSTRDDISEMLHWINPEQYKSLPDIDHAHIICLKKQ